MRHENCIFCKIIAGESESYTVYEDEFSLAFLDIKPLFLGHVLLVPKLHVETLAQLPEELIDPLFRNSKKLSVVVQKAMNAQGSFVAMNNIVSQSVPHLHVHIVPRTKGDGLKGFFWPRQRNINEKLLKDAQQVILQTIRQH